MLLPACLCILCLPGNGFLYFTIPDTIRGIGNKAPHVSLYHLGAGSHGCQLSCWSLQGYVVIHSLQ